MFRLIITVFIIGTLTRVLVYWYKGQQGEKVVEYVMPLYKTWKAQNDLDSTIIRETEGRIGPLYAPYGKYEDIARIDSMMKIHDSLHDVIAAYPKAPSKPDILTSYRESVESLSETQGEKLGKLEALLKDQITFKAVIDENRVQKVVHESAQAEQKFQQIMQEIIVDYPIVNSALQGMKMREVREIVKSM